MTPTNVIPCRLTPELLLDIFDLPVSFHRCLVPITGGVTGALMLSQAIATSETVPPDCDGWFTRTQEEWTEETGLSRCEQQTARRALREAGFLEERRAGMPARLYCRVCSNAILHALQVHAQARRG